MRRTASGLPTRDAAERLLAKVLGEVAQGIPAVPSFAPTLVAPPVRSAVETPRDVPSALFEAVHLLREAGFGMEAGSPGIYFLCRRGSVIYVGQSTDVRARLGQHMRVASFDRALWMRVEIETLTTAERCLIALLDPPLNKEKYALTEPRWAWLERMGFKRPAA